MTFPSKVNSTKLSKIPKQDTFGKQKKHIRKQQKPLPPSIRDTDAPVVPEHQQRRVHHRAPEKRHLTFVAIRFF